MIYTEVALKKIARQVRKSILKMSSASKSAHTGGSLSCVEILVSLYFSNMKNYPTNPNHPKRDRLIFSKGHDVMALYAVLAEKGYFKKKTLEEYESNGTLLSGHSSRDSLPGIEASTGSLGHGLSLAAGIAYVGKLDNKSYRTFAILSDGECDEGSTWEAALFASHHKLNNLIAIVDYNKLQGFGYTKDILNLEPFAEKWIAFGWSVNEIDGHNFKSLKSTLTNLSTKNKPTIVIAHTIKGIGGVDAHINKVSSQYIPPSKLEYKSLTSKNNK